MNVIQDMNWFRSTYHPGSTISFARSDFLEVSMELQSIYNETGL